MAETETESETMTETGAGGAVARSTPIQYATEKS